MLFKLHIYSLKEIKVKHMLQKDIFSIISQIMFVFNER